MVKKKLQLLFQDLQTLWRTCNLERQLYLEKLRFKKKFKEFIWQIKLSLVFFLQLDRNIQNHGKTLFLLYFKFVLSIMFCFTHWDSAISAKFSLYSNFLIFFSQMKFQSFFELLRFRMNLKCFAILIWNAIYKQANRFLKTHQSVQCHLFNWVVSEDPRCDP